VPEAGGFLLRGLAPARESPARWFSPSLLDAARSRALRSAFTAASAPPHVPPHVVVPSPLEVEFARDVASAMEAARFTPHPWASYPLQVARPEEQRASALTAFLAWLVSPDAIGFHTGLVGWPRAGDGLAPLRAFQKVQVQASRMLHGERFPAHVDTDDEGLAAVYNFTRALDPGGAEGGVLEFDDGGLRVPPAFNSLAIFRATNARHRVSEVRSRTGARYSIVAFFLLRPTQPGA
jgi:hypothetical protein